MGQLANEMPQGLVLCWQQAGGMGDLRRQDRVGDSWLVEDLGQTGPAPSQVAALPHIL